MPKRKMSTFERLKTGRQKRNERRELAGRIAKGDQCAFKLLRHGIDGGESRHCGNRRRQRKPFRGRATGPGRPTGSGIRVVDRRSDEDGGVAETVQNPHGGDAGDGSLLDRTGKGVAGSGIRSLGGEYAGARVESAFVRIRHCFSHAAIFVRSSVHDPNS